MTHVDDQPPGVPFGFHVENPYAAPPAKRRLSISIGTRAKAKRSAEEKEERCTLEQLNAILGPHGKHMPGRP